MIMIQPMERKAVPLQRKSSTGTKIKLLLWKNFLLQKRHMKHTIVDICLPIFFFLLCAWLRTKYIPELKNATKTSPKPLTSSANSHSDFDVQPHSLLLFTPNSLNLQTLMNDVAMDLGFKSAEGVALDVIESTFNARNAFAAVEFHQTNYTQLPKKLSYSLRFPAKLYKLFNSDNWNTNLLFPPDAFDGPKTASDMYYLEKFLAIQNAIARNLIKSLNFVGEIPEILVQAMPYPAHTKDEFLLTMQSFGSIFFLFSFNYTFMSTIRFVSTEKEKQLKEAMKIMGLPLWIHWFSWFVRTIIMLSISMIGITILLKVSWFGGELPVFQFSNSVLLFVFFLCYSICITTYSFVISAFFNKVKSATTASSFAWYLSYVPYFLTNEKFYQMSGWLKVLCCFCPNTGMGYALLLISTLEENGIGLSWTSFWKSDNVYDTISVAAICGIMLLSALIFFGITLYLDNIFPGSYGVAKPWNYIFKMKFWKYKRFQGNESEYDGEMANNELLSNNFEREPMNRQAGIEIRNLSKAFGTKLVVDNLSINMFEEQITVLLGHNGAGKTTTISMLIGMIEPTSGTALINGYDIKSNTEMAQNSLGFCPQHNILFDELTVREHITLYSLLKGMSVAEAKNEVERYSDLLGLKDKMNSLSKTLSGGQKRKLSIGIALCGQSKIVFLDEPTSGMDVNARRSLWDILLAEKENRTILLTTHYMDEADVLGDRIAIMAEGELQCCGSSFFLKKRFGTGYHLICAKDNGCNSEMVTLLLRRYLTDIRVENENESEIFYLLPENKVSMFPNIFKDLEDNEALLNLRGFGVSLTTLEEIFLKFAKRSVGNHNEFQNESTSMENRETIIHPENNEVLLTGTSLVINQLMAMFKKRFLFTLRSWKTFLYYNVFVLILLVMSSFDLSFIFKRSNLPPLELTLASYTDSTVLIQDPTLIPNSTLKSILKQLQDDVQSGHEAEVQLLLSDDFSNGILKLGNESLQKYQSQYLTGASVLNSNAIIAWFNNQAYHSSAIALNMVHNAIIKVALEDKDSGIQVINKPFKFIEENKTAADSISQSTNTFGFSFATVIIIAMSIYTSSYAMFYVKECQSKAKQMQLISGTDPVTFWLSSIVWDILIFNLTNIMIIVVLAISQHPGYSSPKDLAEIFLVLFLFSWAVVPFTCLISLPFTSPSSTVNFISIANSVTMVIFYIVTAISSSDIEKSTPFYLYLMEGLPLFALSSALYNMALCKMVAPYADLTATNSIFSWKTPGIGMDLTYMIGTGIISFIILIIIERGGMQTVKSWTMKAIPRTLPQQNDEIDDDVKAEKAGIDSMSENELKRQVLVAQNVSKFYGQFLAVNQISFAVKRAECFGLLGSNGAGKSTIFKMLIGEISPSLGAIYAHGFDLRTSSYKIYDKIGYCPQFDALLEELTCRETLEMYALIHGIQRADIHTYVRMAATNLDFIQHIDKKVSQLSGGNKRKLSTAIALLGDPSIIFLDEPTSGMDPATKRNLWNVVIKLREAGKSIVLTSHSMEECEALCTRLTVLVNGDAKCLGSVQHLKNKFTQGFELKVKVPSTGDDDSNNMNAKQFIAATFRGASLNEEHQGLLDYIIPSGNLKWSMLFTIMENAKQKNVIEDYSISQSSLEQVILSFIKNQKARLVADN